jgi:hypothetical protein
MENEFTKNENGKEVGFKNQKLVIEIEAPEDLTIEEIQKRIESKQKWCAKCKGLWSATTHALS